MAENNYRLEGRVIDTKSGKGLADLQVEAWDRDAKSHDRLGSALTNGQGNFAIQFAESAFKDSPQESGPDLIFKVFDGERLLLNTIKTPIKNWTSEQNPIILELEYALPDEPDGNKPYVVEGKVVDPRGRPLSNLPVRAYDRALCDWRLLGEANTNDLGHYRIGYAQEQLRAWGKERADLKVEVYDRATADEVLAASPLILQALPHEVVDFSIGGEYIGPDEHTRVHDALNPLLEPIDDTACLGVADVLILARDSAQAASNVIFYIKAQAWSTNLNMQPALLYGLLRQGEPAQLDALLAQPLPRLWESLQQARRLNIIDVPLGEVQKAQLSKIQQDYLLQENHPYRQLLDSTSLEPAQQTTFTGYLTSGTLGGEALWRALEKDAGFSSEQVDDLQASFELQSLTGNNTSLTVHLRAEREISHPRETAAYSLEEWVQALAVDGVDIPDAILPGEPEALRRQSYAQALYRTAEARYPTASLSAQMSRDANWQGQPTTAWLGQNPEFEFTEQRFTLFLAEHPDALSAFDDPVTAQQELLRLEQLFHLTASFNDQFATIQPLWDARLSSAPQIATAGRHALMRQVSGQVAITAVNEIYQKAVHSTSVALNTYMRFSPQTNSIALNALQVPKLPQGGATKPSGAAGLPEWESLFGSADGCECIHCESALGPAAYLVDMLSFLSRATDGSGSTGLNAFLARRPDIGMLDLTCENSDTELPQIDLFIEIAEQIVANSSDGITVPTASVGQTTWDSSLLTAQPEHFEPRAYDQLLQAIYPFSLPFDLWLEEGRRYLSQMAVDRAELMGKMPSHPGTGPVDIASESLGLSPIEAEIVATPRQQEQILAAYWGVDLTSGTLRSQLRSVKTLLERSGIDYDRLLRLLSTRYLNPDRLIEVVFAGDSCALDDAELAGGDAIHLLDRSHRFLRLIRRLDWSEAELDQAIRAIGVVDFDDPTFFPATAALQGLRGAYSLSVSDLSTWWADLDSYRYDPDQLSQYETLFLDPARFPETGAATGPDLRNAVFALTPDGTDLAVTQSSDPNLSTWLAESDGAAEPVYTLNDDYTAYVQSATSLTAGDLALLVAEILPKDPALGHVALNLANLSLLYRIGSFTRALGLSVPDYIRLLRLTGMEPLTTANGQTSPLDTEQFVAAWNKIDEGVWSLEELDYLLLHGSESTAALSPDPVQVEELLQGLSAGFAGVTGTTASDLITAAKDDEENLDLAVQSLGTTLGLDPELVKELLFTVRADLGDRLLEHLILAANPGLTSVTPPAQEFYILFETLHKFALAWKPLNLASAHLDFVLSVGPGIGWTDIATLPFAEQVDTGLPGWHRLALAAELQGSLFTEELSLFGLLSEAHRSPPTLTREWILLQTSEWTGWSLDDLTYLLGPNGFDAAWPDDFRDERWLSKLEQAFALTRPLGVSASQAHTWTRPSLGYQDTQAIKQALTLAYDHDTWLDVMAGVQDALRVLRRDALLAYLLSQRPGEDAADLYAYYLIDPQMDPCATTSRMVQAHASVQLFAQRILLNLEPPLAFPREDTEAWQWRRYYRVWQAAREVLIFTENWLLSEVRDNKSEFFRELEDGLLQDEVTSENAEVLYREYLYKLDEVSRLEIMGMYQDENTNVLHAFGRSEAIPHRYYYRRWEDRACWTAWEPVELDIQSDHLIPIVYNGQLWLFWPEFRVTELSEDSGTDGATSSTTNGDNLSIEDLEASIDDLDRQLADLDGQLTLLSPDAGKAVVDSQIATIEQLITALEQLRQELQFEIDKLKKATLAETFRYDIELNMAWSRYDSGGWRPKSITSEPATFQTDFDANKHFFSGWIAEDKILRIAVRNVTGERSETSVTEVGYPGYFYFDECNGNLQWTNAQIEAPTGETYLVGSYQRYQSWDAFIADTLELTVTQDAGTQYAVSTWRTLLTQVQAGASVISFAHQYGLGGSQDSPFFCNDGQRTWFVNPGVFIPGLAVHSAAETSVRAQRSLPSATGAVRSAGQLSTQGLQADASNQIVDHSLGSAATGGTPDHEWIEKQLSTESDFAPIPDAALGDDRKYYFTRFYDPHACLFLKQLSRYGVDGLLNPDPALDDDSENLYRQLTPNLDFDFAATYVPTYLVGLGYPDEAIDFDHASPYGSYYWELFFHIPFLMATRLTEYQRFEEGRRWFHCIFDPTNAEGGGSERFWKIKPFYQHQLDTEAKTLQELIALSKEGDRELEQQVHQWENDPFQPHRVARMRTIAYMQSTLMGYLDNLIGEGDMLFTRDDRESINAAAQLYLLASEILGDRPVQLPSQGRVTYTANDLLGLTGGGTQPHYFLDALENINQIFPPTQPGVSPARAEPHLQQGDSAAPAYGGTTVYDTLLLFCIPPNAKLLAYWDTVDDRLFKIRHCMNLEGQVRRLALYSPRIDPELLVKATAAGLDIATIISALYAPLPHFRFSYMLQKALELCGEVRSLGAAVLSGLEKKDAEALAELRSGHEVQLLKLVRQIKERQIEEALTALEGAQKTRKVAEKRQEEYQTYLDKGRNRHERKQLSELEKAKKRQKEAQIMRIISSGLHSASAFFSAGVKDKKFLEKAADVARGLAYASDGFAGVFSAMANDRTYHASKASLNATYARRNNDWNLQKELADKELQQIDKQILAAEIRLQIAENDLENQDQQIVQSQATEAFLKFKFTNQELYSWMLSELSGLHFQAYQMASQLALQAQRTFQHELGPDESSLDFIQATYWDSLKKGLLAGEQLHYDLRRMEQAHIEANRRELEITKTVSLFQLDPEALLSLRTTGVCTFHIPEVLYALDFPAHYFRRIKAVRMTIPSVVGPTTNVSATLTLTESWIRRAADISTDPEAVTASLPQVSIAASTANNDSGLFELNFNDPRYLPFEGAGAVSSWNLELPTAIRPFDYTTISDVMLHISFTAQDGGSTFKNAVNEKLKEQLNDLKILLNENNETLSRLISLRRELPNEWHRLLNPAAGQAQEIVLTIDKTLFPGWLDFIWQDSDKDGQPGSPVPISLNITSAILYLQPEVGRAISVSDVPIINGQSAVGLADDSGLFHINVLAELSSTAIGNDAGIELHLNVDDADLLSTDWDDLYLLLNYTVET